MTELDDPPVPTSREIDRSGWALVVRRAWHGFMRHRGIDAAATLAYFSALALFPGSLIVVSTFAIANNRAAAAENILAVVGEFVSPDTVDTLSGPIGQLLAIPNPGIAFAVAFVLTLWTISSYATAFGRAVNGVYEVEEGRMLWKFRGLMMLVTLMLMVAFGAIAVILFATPRATSAIAETAGFGEPWVSIWNVGKWPLLAILLFVVVAVLYYATPNVRHSRVRWVSWGALFAIVAWGVATAGFFLYIATVAQYDRVYGWLGGGVVALLYLYLTNVVLILGAELDAEIVRVRQLSAGIPAERMVKLPLRDSTRNLILARQRAADEADGRRIRDAAGAESQPVVGDTPRP